MKRVNPRKWIGFLCLLALLMIDSLSAQEIKISTPLIATSPNVLQSSNYKAIMGSSSKLSTALLQVHEQAQAQHVSSSALSLGSPSFQTKHLLESEGKILIQILAKKDAAILQNSLGSYVQVVGAYQKVLNAWINPLDIPRLALEEEVQFVSPVYRPNRFAGSVISQGDSVIGTDFIRNLFGFTGAGSKIGILSDSYDLLNGESVAIITGDLPGTGNPDGNTTPVQVIEEFPFGLGQDEGRAIAEIIHDIAPGAELAFHTGFLGEANFAEGIQELIDAGANIIIEDIIYPTEPFFQNGLSAQAINASANQNVSTISAAGNLGRQSYESDFRPGSPMTLNRDSVLFGPGNTLGEYVLHDFDPGEGVDYFQRVDFNPDDEILLSFQWDQTFASLCQGCGGAESNLDIFIAVRDEDLSSILVGAVDLNIGNDPIELLSVANGDIPTEAYILIGKRLEEGATSPDPELIKYVNFRDSIGIEYASNSSTIVGHLNTTGGIAVAAVPYFDTIPEPFTSLGGTPLLFDDLGLRTTPLILEKPEVSAPDQVNTTFFAAGNDIESDGSPNFSGTSASAAHVAGLTALILESAGVSLAPSQIRSLLTSTARDLDDPFTPGFDVGYDPITGFGLVQAIPAVSNAQGILVESLGLYNAVSDTLLRNLSDGDRINISDLGTNNLTIRAFTQPEIIGGVFIDITGDLVSSRQELIEPYTAFANMKNNFFGREFQFGNYTVKATPFSNSFNIGTIGLEKEVNFSLIEQVDEFLLINSASDTVISPIVDGSVVSLKETGDRLNIQALTTGDENVGSVDIELRDALSNALVASRVENNPPYALFANNGSNFLDGSISPGFYFLKATPYAQRDAVGFIGDPMQILIEVVDSITNTSGGEMMGANTQGRKAFPAYSVRAFPNPTQESLLVSYNSEKVEKLPFRVTLYDQSGKIVYQKLESNAKTPGHKIDVKHMALEEGIYFLKVEDTLHQEVIRIVVEK